MKCYIFLLGIYHRLARAIYIKFVAEAILNAHCVGSHR